MDIVDILRTADNVTSVDSLNCLDSVNSFCYGQSASNVTNVDAVGEADGLHILDVEAIVEIWTL